MNLKNAMRYGLLLILYIIYIILITYTPISRTYYVAKIGNDNDTVMKLIHGWTIQKAANTMSAGDTCLY